MTQKKVGIINSGGDCPGLNTAIDAIVCSLSPEYEIIGFYKGFEGLLNLDFIKLNPENTFNLRFEGGTFLKSINKGSFAAKTGNGVFKQIDRNVLNQAYQNYQDLGLEALIVLGGDGSMSAAIQMQEIGVNIIGIPKSIDNDLKGTDFTFGFNTAVGTATDALDRLSTTAKSHDRIMILEVMGRHTGWIGLYSGLAGGADMILIPEIPFESQNIIDFFEQKYQNGQTHGLIVVSEGCKDGNGETINRKNDTEFSEVSLGGIGNYIANLINNQSKLQIEARCTVLGHLQRGGSPNSQDRILSRSYGAYASTILRNHQYGSMVGYIDGDFTHVKLEDCVDKLKFVDPEHDLVKIAKNLGVSFGD